MKIKYCFYSNFIVEKFEKSTKVRRIKYYSTKYNIETIFNKKIENQLKERDLKIEELNYTIRQISQDKMNPTELFLNTPLEKSIISPFQPQESTHSRPSRASIQNTLKSFPRPHLFDDSSMESTNTDDSTTTRNLRISTGMEIDEEEEYTTPPPPQQQSNPNTNMNGNGRVVVVNRLSNPLPTSPPPFVSNLHTPSPPPPPVSTRTISSAATITAGSITSATSSLSLPSQQQQRQLLQFDYSSEDNNIDIDYVDPDNMTYDELIQLGQRIGDVATEQWKMKCKPIINVFYI